MKASIKKTLSTLLSGIILFSGALSYSASASGDIARSTIKAGSQVKVTYSFDVDGNKTDPKNNRNNNYKYGQHSNEGFVTSKQKTVTLRYGGASYSSAKFEIYKQDKDGDIVESGKPIATVSVPKVTNGMPTLSRTITLPAGKYAVKVISESESSSSKGAVTISYADGVN